MRYLYNKLTQAKDELSGAVKTSDAPEISEQKWYLDTVLDTRSKLMVALERMLSREESEEVIQEVYLKLFLNFQHEKPENPTAYVFRLARNLAITRLRSHQVAERFTQSLSEVANETLAIDEPQQTFTEEKDKALLLEAINSLPPICRQVFVLRKLHDKSHQEIAKDLEISVKTVENHITKGMQLCHNYVSRSRIAAKIKSAKKLA